MITLDVRGLDCCKLVNESCLCFSVYHFGKYTVNSKEIQIPPPPQSQMCSPDNKQSIKF